MFNLTLSYQHLVKRVPMKQFQTRKSNYVAVNKADPFKARLCDRDADFGNVRIQFAQVRFEGDLPNNNRANDAVFGQEDAPRSWS